MDDKTVDKAEAIARLVDLHADGKITDEELETLRAEAAKPASNDSVALKLAVGLLALVGAIGLFVLLTNGDDSAEEESAPSTTVTEQPSTAPTSTLAVEEPVVVPTTEAAAQPVVIPTTEAAAQPSPDPARFAAVRLIIGGAMESLTWEQKRSAFVNASLESLRVGQEQMILTELVRTGASGSGDAQIVKCVIQKQNAETNIEDVLTKHAYFQENARMFGRVVSAVSARPLGEKQLRLMDEVYAPAKVRTLIRECS